MADSFRENFNFNSTKMQSNHLNTTFILPSSYFSKHFNKNARTKKNPKVKLSSLRYHSSLITPSTDHLSLACERTQAFLV